MNLKTYQKKVLSDLARYLELMVDTQSASKAFHDFWEEQGVLVETKKMLPVEDGVKRMSPYQDNLSGVPHVCAKVPTGGGKTFIAASAVKTIFDAMPNLRTRAVIWLVPSEAILSQTWKALNNVNHDYRQRLDVDFRGRVQLYCKEQALMGQDFTPDTARENLSVFVLSYDSFRTSKKEGRKAYQENGYLRAFAKEMKDPSVLLADTDETALIQVIRYLNPVVIVDESHHAVTDLSVEMLRNFNPCFVLDLTATPRKNSNIISFVDAQSLKDEDMIKLPVIVYNRKSQGDVYGDAINIQMKLEAQAKEDRKTTGRYIRPIVLFQAQPRGTPDRTTYEKIKKTLLDAGIPEQEIAIKTGDRDDLKNVDLLSENCQIRYIITVNALKEGWDCPFAYVLATVANRTSVIDVEQILGRILRLPDTRKNPGKVLNMSYVLTSSADFHQTLKQIVRGLNSAGFTDQEFRAPELEEPKPPCPTGEQISTDQLEAEQDMPEVDGASLKERVEAARQEAEQGGITAEKDPLLSTALEENAAAETRREQAGKAGGQNHSETGQYMNHFTIKEEYREEAAALRIPQFVLDLRFLQPPEKGVFCLFPEEDSLTPLLTKENLEKGFTLLDKDAHVDFSTLDAEMARVDIDDDKDRTPRAWQLSGADSLLFREWFTAQPSEKRLSMCKDMIRNKLSKRNSVNDRELSDYIDRVMATMSEDQISEMEQSPYPYVKRIDDKVKLLLSEQRRKNFDLWYAQRKIICKPHYALPAEISPTKHTNIIPKSLYTAEEDNMNKYERETVWKLSALRNVKWWHRNISRRGFQINGPFHMYPDMIVMLHSGRILVVETKGDYLEGESEGKARIGDLWAQQAGEQYQYYMVLESKQSDYPGMCSQERFLEIIKEL